MKEYYRKADIRKKENWKYILLGNREVYIYSAREVTQHIFKYVYLLMAIIECHSTGFIEKHFKYGYTSAGGYQELIMNFTSLFEVDERDSWFQKEWRYVVYS
jgi:hypothetical protein